MTKSGISSVRRWVVRLTIGSFSLAALLGVAALLRPGRFGNTEGRILLTTLVVGATSVLMLCYLAASGDRTRVLGAAGGLAALLSAAAALMMLWGYRHSEPPIWLGRTFGVSAIVALTLAQFSLLLAVVRRRPSVLRLLAATIALGTVLAGLLVVVVLGWKPSDAGARVLGVVAILDVLGTVVTMALGIFGGEPRPAGAALAVSLPAPVAEAVRARATATGRAPEDVVLEAVRAYVGSDAGS